MGLLEHKITSVKPAFFAVVWISLSFLFFILFFYHFDKMIISFPQSVLPWQIH